ncbi:MAG: methyltransferase domain-containing protein [Raineya sp.]|nr:methyltransferase domain-containing protein [Raineya sp.]
MSAFGYQMVRLHYNLCEAVVGALEAIFNQKQYADKVLERLLKSNPKWGARDRAFIAESTYEIVRWWRKLLFLANEKYQENNEKYEKGIFWRVLGTFLLTQHKSIPAWQVWENLSLAKITENSKKITERAILHSIPDWLDKIGEKELGKDIWERELAILNQPAEVVLRVNTLKTSIEGLQKALQSQNIATQTTPYSPDALILCQRQNIFQNPLFKEGYFEVQDVGSQEIARFLRVQAGMRVIDACAGAGGKTLHLASLMQNKGRIIAMDTEAWKLTELKRRAKRNGVSIVETRLIESNKVIKRLANSADRLLLDVPCSGLGVLRRNPDAKWKLSERFLTEIQEKQYQILRNYSQMLKKGGLMVYATCSILPSENERQVERFLVENKMFRLLDSRYLFPSEYGFDGFFMALLEKTQ